MKIVVTSHAAQRYIERVKPALDLLGAEFELHALARLGAVEPAPPEWVPETAEGADQWLVVSDGIVVPLKRNVATTVLVRGSIPPEIRASRKHAKKARRKRDRITTRGKRVAQRWEGEDEWQ